MGDTNKEIEKDMNDAADYIRILDSVTAQVATNVSTYATSIANSAASIASSFALIQSYAYTGLGTSPYPPGPSTPVNSTPVPTKQFGGSVYANTPTMALFGDVP